MKKSKFEVPSPGTPANVCYPLAARRNGPSASCCVEEEERPKLFALSPRQLLMQERAVDGILWTVRLLRSDKRGRTRPWATTANPPIRT